MIKSDFVCPECENHLELRHSIREKPEVKCPECSALMVRDISGGSHRLVKGGKSTIHQDKGQSAKDRADMAHATKVANHIRNHAQPKTRNSFLERPSIKGETQPATPGKRIVKPDSSE